MQLKCSGRLVSRPDMLKAGVSVRVSRVLGLCAHKLRCLGRVTEMLLRV